MVPEHSSHTLTQQHLFQLAMDSQSHPQRQHHHHQSSAAQVADKLSIERYLQQRGDEEPWNPITLGKAGPSAYDYKL